MREQFVPYEIAIKLKEKGFIDECMANYEISLTAQENEEDGFSGPFGWKKGEVNFNKAYFVNNSLFDFSNENWLMCAAPLWQQVIDWFRTKHNIDISVFAGVSHVEATPIYWWTWVTRIEDLLNSDVNKNFQIQKATFEEARQTGIEHALTLI